MRIVFGLDIGVNVENYEEAGQILDRLISHTKGTIGPSGRWDVTNFRARHRDVESAEKMNYPMEETTTDSY